MAGVLSRTRNRNRKKRIALTLLLLDDDIDMRESASDVPVRVMKKWLRKRISQGAYENLCKEMQSGDDASYTNFFRMDHETFTYILDHVVPYITKEDTNRGNTITAGERLGLTLRFLATGESFRSLQYLFRVSERAISGIVKETTWYIYHALREEYLKTPSDETEWHGIAKGFNDRWNVPHCCGALDGKHIVIKAPDKSGSKYFNYKGSFSIVLLALVDSDYKFIFVDAGTNGRVADGGVFAHSLLKRGLDEGTIKLPEQEVLSQTDLEFPYFFVADDAFPLSDYMLKPYPRSLGEKMTKEQAVYNYRLCRGRRIVENAFGILANRFRIFLTKISLDPDVVEVLCLAACALHNLLRIQRSHIYICRGLADAEHADKSVRPGDWRNDEGCMFELEPTRMRNSAKRVKALREAYATYLNSAVGSVPWQDSMS